MCASSLLTVSALASALKRVTMDYRSTITMQWNVILSLNVSLNESVNENGRCPSRWTETGFLLLLTRATTTAFSGA